MSKPKLIIVEGSEGVGKTTFINNINNYLLNLDTETYSAGSFISTPVMGSGDIGKAVRATMLADGFKRNKVYEASLGLAAVNETIHNFIIPKLKNGVDIIVDRWFYSTLVYNTAQQYFNDPNEPTINPNDLETHTKAVYSFFLLAMLDVIPLANVEIAYLRADPKTSLDRIIARNDNNAFDKVTLDDLIILDNRFKNFISYTANNFDFMKKVKVKEMWTDKIEFDVTRPNYDLYAEYFAD